MTREEQLRLVDIFWREATRMAGNNDERTPAMFARVLREVGFLVVVVPPGAGDQIDLGKVQAIGGDEA